MESNELLPMMEQSLLENKIEELLGYSNEYIVAFPEKKEGYLFLGKAYWKKNNFKKALLKFYDAEDRVPNDIEVLFCLAEINFASRNFSASRTYYNKIIQIESKNTAAIVGLADIDFEDEMYFDAIQNYTKVLESNVDSETVIYKCASSYVELDEEKEALAFLDKYMKDEFNEPLMVLKKSIYQKLGREFEDKALECVETLHKNVPDNPIYIIELAQLYRKEDDYSKLEATYSKIINLDISKKDKLTAYESRAYVRNELEDYNGALEDYNQLIESEAKWYFYEYRGVVQLKLKNAKKALSDFNKAIEIQKEYSTLRHRGQLFLKAKSYDKAISDFTACAKMNSSDSVNYYDLGVAYTKSGDKKKGFMMLLEADKYGSAKAQDYLIGKYAKQVAAMKDKSDQKFMHEFKDSISRNESSSILQKAFGKLWRPDMDKNILAMGNEIYSFPEPIVKQVLESFAKDLFLITSSGVLFIEDGIVLEAYYKVEIESSHAIVLEIQPSKGGDVSRMRILFQNETLVLSYPLQSKEVPAKYFKPLEPSAVSSSLKVRLNDNKGVQYMDSIKSFIDSCG